MEEGPETLYVDGGEGGRFVERVEEGIACAEGKLDKRRLCVSAEILAELNIGQSDHTLVSLFLEAEC